MSSEQFKQKYVMVGEIRMTMQAYIVCILGLVLAAFIFFSAMYFLLKGKYALATMLLFGSVLIFGVFLYSAYIVNCTVVGQCHILSWVMVAFYVAFVVMKLYVFIGTFTLLNKYVKK